MTVRPISLALLGVLSLGAEPWPGGVSDQQGRAYAIRMTATLLDGSRWADAPVLGEYRRFFAGTANESVFVAAPHGHDVDLLDANLWGDYRAEIGSSRASSRRRSCSRVYDHAPDDFSEWCSDDPDPDRCIAFFRRSVPWPSAILVLALQDNGSCPFSASETPESFCASAGFRDGQDACTEGYASDLPIAGSGDGDGDGEDTGDAGKSCPVDYTRESPSPIIDGGFIGCRALGQKPSRESDLVFHPWGSLVTRWYWIGAVQCDPEHPGDCWLLERDSRSELRWIKQP